MDPHGFTVIVQRRAANGGSAACHGLVSPVPAPTRFVVMSDAVAARWRDDLADRILDSFARTATTPAEGCSGPGWLECWATSAPVASHLLIVVTSTDAPTENLETATAAWLDAGFPALGVVRSGVNPDHVLPRSLRQQQALLWSADVGEVLNDVLDAALLAGQERRLFISYSHADGASLAVQLQNDLTAARFDVFLDRFVLQPGANFLERIHDELRDKGVVLVVETPRALTSRWVITEEVNTAIKLGLTVLAYHPGSGAGLSEIPEVDRCRRLADVVDHVIARHRLGLMDRQRTHQDSLRNALKDGGVGDQEIAWTALGCRVRSDYEVALSVRPADLRRARVLWERAGSLRRVLIHPWPYSAPRRRDLEWLCDRGDVTNVELSNLVVAATDIAGRTL